MSSVRFKVSKPDEGTTIGESGSSTDPVGYGSASPNIQFAGTDGKGENNSRESDPLTTMMDGEVSDHDRHMALYEDEFAGRPMVSRVISQLVNYEGGVQPAPGPTDGEDAKPKAKKVSKLGTVLGVYFPCIQNIFGVILFIRLTWQVGVAGWFQGFFIVLICCCTTMLTAISMSAIATNGRVPSGGSYFLISRSLGPEFGGAVGILFYLGTSVASSMYIIGAVEILLKYMAPSIAIFQPITDEANAYNNYRIYGSILLFIMLIWVFLGVKFVSKFSPIALLCVIVSIISIYIGIFVAAPHRGPTICLVDGRIIKSSYLYANETKHCYKNESGPLYKVYCPPVQDNSSKEQESCDFFKNAIVEEKPGIPGIMSGIFMDNFQSVYEEKGDVVGKQGEKAKSEAEIVLDNEYTSFVILLAIFFPSVTGIMAGSNRSGDLADASSSIPRGTIAAITTTSIVYLSCVLFFGATIDGNLMRDKFGESLDGGLVVANLAWPNPWVILIGSFLSTVGAGLQSLTGAPRLLQAIAADGVIPFLNGFSATTARGEPLRALLLTGLISLVGVLIASLDLIAPIITMFFLMCYGFVNLACALQTLLRTPNWRPRFRFYHWTLSLIGVILCIVLMFLSGWYFALLAIGIAAFVYKYVEYKGAEKEWGDGIRGLAMSAARFALLRLEEGPPHVKNWRPQVLILLKLDDALQPKYKKHLSFSSQLKAGKGLTLIGTVIKGNLRDKYADAQAAHQSIGATMKAEKVKGFAEVLCFEDVSAGLDALIQTSGVGGLRHNTVLLGWPSGWRKTTDEHSYRVFIDTLKSASHSQLAVIIPKGIDQFPTNNDKYTGTIDVWWIVHDGGLLMLLPFLLLQHKVWKGCRMRIFTVAQMEDNSIQMKKDLLTFLYHLRINAEVQVVEMPDSDISAYTYERTMLMEQRTEMLKEMRFGKKDVAHMPQTIVDSNHPITTLDGKLSVSPKPQGASSNTSLNNEFTFSPSTGDKFKKDLLNLKPDHKNVRRMHTAVRLNEVIVQKSHEAKLVILNLPGPPKKESGEQNYMEYLEVLTEGLERVLMVRGGGREVITMYT